MILISIFIASHAWNIWNICNSVLQVIKENFYLRVKRRVNTRISGLMPQARGPEVFDGLPTMVFSTEISAECAHFVS
jgi:hypothetical protein